MTRRKSVGYFGTQVTLDSRQLRFNNRRVGGRISGDLARMTLPGEVTLGWGLERGQDDIDFALFDQQGDREHPYVVALPADDSRYLERCELQPDGTVVLPKGYLRDQGRRMSDSSLEMRIVRHASLAVITDVDDIVARAQALNVPDAVMEEIQIVRPERERVANALTPLIFVEMFPGVMTFDPPFAS